MHYKKPFYMLKINSEFTRSCIFINGCLLDYNIDGYPVNVEYPINHYLKPGKNTVEIEITESIDHNDNNKTGFLPDGKASCVLSVVDYDNPDNGKTKVAEFLYSAKSLRVTGRFAKHQTMDELLATVNGSTQSGRFNVVDGQCIRNDEGSIGVNKAEVDYINPAFGGQLALFSFPVELPVPFPEPEFFSAEDQRLERELDDDQFDAFSQELTKELEPIWELVNQNRISDLAPYFKERCLEYDRAFYTAPGQNLKELLDAIQDKYNDENWVLHPLDESEIGIDIFLNRKVVYLCSSPMKHNLKFYDGHGLQNEFPIYWAKLNGKWKIVR